MTFFNLVTTSYFATSPAHISPNKCFNNEELHQIHYLFHEPTFKPFNHKTPEINLGGNIHTTIWYCCMLFVPNSFPGFFCEFTDAVPGNL